jgi:hypothetical protein
MSPACSQCGEVNHLLVCGKCYETTKNEMLAVTTIPQVRGTEMQRLRTQLAEAQRERDEAGAKLRDAEHAAEFAAVREEGRLDGAEQEAPTVGEERAYEAGRVAGLEAAAKACLVYISGCDNTTWMRPVDDVYTRIRALLPPAPSTTSRRAEAPTERGTTSEAKCPTCRGRGEVASIGPGPEWIPCPRCKPPVCAMCFDDGSVIDIDAHGCASRLPCPACAAADKEVTR